MNKKVFLYGKDYDKVHMFPNGEVATPEVMLEKYPAIEYFPQMVELVGNTIMAVQDFEAMRQFYNIESELTEEEALAAIEVIINTEPEQDMTATPEERTAAAMEIMAMNSMTDIVTE